MVLKVIQDCRYDIWYFTPSPLTNRLPTSYNHLRFRDLGTYCFIGNDYWRTTYRHRHLKQCCCRACQIFQIADCCCLIFTYYCRRGAEIDYQMMPNASSQNQNLQSYSSYDVPLGCHPIVLLHRLHQMTILMKNCCYLHHYFIIQIK